MPLLEDANFNVLFDAGGIPMSDVETGPRTAEQIRDEWLLELLPQGWAWPKVARANLAALLMALAVSRETLEADIDALKLEIWPGSSLTLLDDYQAVLGPDPLGRDTGVLTVEERQALLGQRWTAGGGQTLAFYERMAAVYGVTITIEEPEPDVCGPAICGEAVCGDVALRFYWIVNMDQDNADLRAAIEHNAPGDTVVVFQVNGVYV